MKHPLRVTAALPTWLPLMLVTSFFMFCFETCEGVLACIEDWAEPKEIK